MELEEERDGDYSVEQLVEACELDRLRTLARSPSFLAEFSQAVVSVSDVSVSKFWETLASSQSPESLEVDALLTLGTFKPFSVEQGDLSRVTNRLRRVCFSGVSPTAPSEEPFVNLIEHCKLAAKTCVEFEPVLTHFLQDVFYNPPNVDEFKRGQQGFNQALARCLAIAMRDALESPLDCFGRCEEGSEVQFEAACFAIDRMLVPITVPRLHSFFVNVCAKMQVDDLRSLAKTLVAREEKDRETGSDSTVLEFVLTAIGELVGDFSVGGGARTMLTRLVMELLKQVLLHQLLDATDLCTTLAKQTCDSIDGNLGTLAPALAHIEAVLLELGDESVQLPFEASKALLGKLESLLPPRVRIAQAPDSIAEVRSPFLVWLASAFSPPSCEADIPVGSVMQTAVSVLCLVEPSSVDTQFQRWRDTLTEISLLDGTCFEQNSAKELVAVVPESFLSHETCSWLADVLGRESANKVEHAMQRRTRIASPHLVMARNPRGWTTTLLAMLCADATWQIKQGNQNACLESFRRQEVFIDLAASVVKKGTSRLASIDLQSAKASEAHLVFLEQFERELETDTILMRHALRLATSLDSLDLNQAIKFSRFALGACQEPGRDLEWVKLEEVLLTQICDTVRRSFKGEQSDERAKVLLECFVDASTRVATGTSAVLRESHVEWYRKILDAVVEHLLQHETEQTSQLLTESSSRAHSVLTEVVSSRWKALLAETAMLPARILSLLPLALGEFEYAFVRDTEATSSCLHMQRVGIEESLRMLQHELRLEMKESTRLVCMIARFLVVTCESFGKEFEVVGNDWRRLVRCGTKCLFWTATLVQEVSKAPAGSKSSLLSEEWGNLLAALEKLAVLETLLCRQELSLFVGLRKLVQRIVGGDEIVRSVASLIQWCLARYASLDDSDNTRCEQVETSLERLVEQQREWEASMRNKKSVSAAKKSKSKGRRIASLVGSRNRVQARNIAAERLLEAPSGRRRSKNTFIDLGLQESAAAGDSDGYEDLEDFIVCKGDKDYYE